MNQEKLLRKGLYNQTFFTNLFQNNPFPIFFLDTEGNLICMNKPFEQLFGINIDEKISFFQLVNNEKANFYFGEALNGKANVFEMTATLPKGNTLLLTTSFTPIIENHTVIGVYGATLDHTKYKIVEQKIKIAGEDNLTGLPNRFHFINELEETIKIAKKNNEKFAIFIIDINRFRIINDTLGYVLGDQALITLSKRIKAFKGDNNFLARMGGDEFVLLLKTIQSIEEVKEFAQKILNTVNDPFIIEGYEFTLTSSIGISIFPDHGVDPQNLIKTADAAMTRAKMLGTNHYEIYTSEMSRRFHEWFQVEKFLHRALERDEFQLYYQPQFYTSTKKICGIEVLVRWQHPEEGLISPGRFIEIAEKTGLIGPIGEWVLLQGCKQMKSWIDSGHPSVPLSVNVSLKQFMQKDFVQIVEKVLEESQLPPENLSLEVTESVTMNLTVTQKIVKQLKELGVKISLDDFGTGYSSLQYLSELPMDELKIDKTFVDGICENHRSKAIISMIVNLGHLLNLSVIAEGVESEEQFAYLLEQGCDKVQGYLFSKPLSAVQYEKIYL